MSTPVVVSTQAAAARAAKLRRQHEEDSLTPYSEADLEKDWQFKIVTGNFSTPALFKAVCEEQGRWGWVFVEKFDDQRVRFKRPASEAEKDAGRQGDPFKSQSTAAAGCAPALVFLCLGALSLYWLTLA